ncbi:MAG: pyridoxal phosphate-dependent aminotransferase [Nitrososphaerota archaeon]
MKISKKSSEGILGEGAFDVLAKAKMLESRGVRVIHLEIGEPDFDTPEHIKRAANEAIMRGETHYTPSAGIQPLREAIAEYVGEYYGVKVDWASQVAVSTGAKQAIFAALCSIVEEGDEVICPDPGYPPYADGVRFSGGKPVFVRLRPEDEFRMTPEGVSEAISSRTRAVIINSPHNPCGSMLTRDQVKGICELAEDHDLWIISDEIYRGIQFDDFEHFSPMTFTPERVILIDGFSKRYAMTGWRLGYAVAPPEVLKNIVKVLNVTTSCPAAFTQWAAITALRGPQDFVKWVADTFRRRRDVALAELDKSDSLRYVRPTGAFYVFVDVSSALKKLKLDSKGFMEWFMEKRQVAVLHGSSMGPSGEGWIRISFGNSDENVREGCRRLVEEVDRVVKS